MFIIFWNNSCLISQKILFYKFQIWTVTFIVVTNKWKQLDSYYIVNNIVAKCIFNYDLLYNSQFNLKLFSNKVECIILDCIKSLCSIWQII